MNSRNIRKVPVIELKLHKKTISSWLSVTSSISKKSLQADLVMFFVFHLLLRELCPKETQQKNSLKACNSNQAKWCTSAPSAAVSSPIELIIAGTRNSQWEHSSYDRVYLFLCMVNPPLLFHCHSVHVPDDKVFPLRCFTAMSCHQKHKTPPE